MSHKPKEVVSPHKILSAISDDGIIWTPENKLIIPWGSAHEAIYGPDRNVLLFYVDRNFYISLAKSDDGLNFSNAKIIIWPRNEGEYFIDPNPVVLPDGSIRIYLRHLYNFLKQESGNIKSEILAFRSKDWEAWTLEEDVRYVDPEGKQGARAVMDPFVVWLNGNNYRLYRPKGGRITGIADSIDGGKTFPIERKSFYGGDVAQVIRIDSRWRMYYVSGEIESGKPQYTGLAESPDGLKWKIMKNITFKGGWGAHVLKLPDGKYRMYYLAPNTPRYAYSGSLTLAVTGPHASKSSES